MLNTVSRLAEPASDQQVNSTRQIPEYVPRLIKFDQQLGELCIDALVLTPNNRLADALRQAFVQFQLDAGNTAWRTARIHSFGEFLPTYYARLQNAWPKAFAALPLNNAQQRLVWLASLPEVKSADEHPDWLALSRLAIDGWATLNEWHIDIETHQFQLNDTSAFYQNWTRLFKKRLRKNNWITHSELPDAIRLAMPRGIEFLPPAIVLYGFETETRQQSALMNTLESSGLEIVRKKIITIRDAGRLKHPKDSYQHTEDRYTRVHQLADEDSELAHAANWARRLVDNNQQTNLPSVGIIVPDLELQHARIVRQFDTVFSPSSEDTDPMLRSYNISGGTSLKRSTVCSDALRLLRWAATALRPEEFARLRESPYLNLSGLEKINFSRNFPISMPYTNRKIESAVLRKISTIEAIKNPGDLPLSKWSEVFLEILEMAQWPIVGTLESIHFQAAERFRRILEELKNDVDIIGPCDLTSAVAHLESLAEQVRYSPESSEVPVQIMTALEADGLSFDYVWLLGFHNRAWPAIPTTNPFIPRSLLLEKNIPRSSLQSELAFAQRYIGNLLDHCERVIFSYASYSGDEEFSASKLVNAPVTRIGESGPGSLSHPLAESLSLILEDYNDFQATEFTSDTKTKGGSSLLRDQSNCPFLALANYRLKASTKNLQEAFPDASDRGSILHKVLELFFTRVESQEALTILAPAERTEILKEIIDFCITENFARFPKPFRKREVTRLLDLAQEWLVVELQRPPFRVLGNEQAMECDIAGLRLDTRIDRIDVDEVTGEHIIIDYKTGAVNVKDWGGSRPKQPQLPMYALFNNQTKSLFYARVKTGECKYMGISETYTPDNGKGIQLSGFADLGAENWKSLLGNWRFALSSLSKEFQSGYAEVRPVNRKICEYCEYQSLCRITAQGKLSNE